MRAVSRSPKRIDKRYSAAPRDNSFCSIWMRRARIAASVLGFVTWELIFHPAQLSHYLADMSSGFSSAVQSKSQRQTLAGLPSKSSVLKAKGHQPTSSHQRAYPVATYTAQLYSHAACPSGTPCQAQIL